MNTQIIIGGYQDIEKNLDTVRLYVGLPSNEINKYWSRCGLISNFSAAYIALACSTDKNITNSLSFVINELLENSVKYSHDKSKKIDIYLLQNLNMITVEVSNYTSYELFEKFRESAKYLIDTEYINTKYLDLMTSNIKVGSNSGIGLLTIINYYNVGISFKFQKTEEPETFYKVSVQVKINTKEL